MDRVEDHESRKLPQRWWEHAWRSYAAGADAPEQRGRADSHEPFHPGAALPELSWMEKRHCHPGTGHEDLSDVRFSFFFSSVFDSSPERGDGIFVVWSLTFYFFFFFASSFTSVRLIQPQMTVSHAAQVALAFEQKALRDANQKVWFACRIL